MSDFHKISVQLNNRSYEYDVYTLVIAFFQGVAVHVFDPGEEMPPDTDLRIAVSLGEEELCVALEDLRGSSGFAAKQPEGEGSESDAKQPEGEGSKSDAEQPEGEGSGSAAKQPEREGSESDAKQPEGEGSESDAGQPGGGITAAPVRERRVPLAEELGRMEEKNLLKSTLYEMLRDFAGHDLPWGNLTGIRPVKLAMDFLREAERTYAGAPAQSVGEPAPSVSDDEALREDHPDAERLPGAASVPHETAVRRMEQVYYVSRQKADLAVRIAEREKAILDRIRPQEGYSLYIGIPFCPSICLYCSFSSSPLKLWKDRTEDYLNALIRELRESRGCFPGRQLQTVYIGGGTPTTLEPDQLDRLLTAVRDYYDLDHVLEFTVEAGRPDSITREKLQVLKEHGVSRISINPQTMNQKTLDLIGRRHTVEETVEAFHLARDLGFDNINMDLIVGLPGEGIREVSHTMEEICRLDPDDVTVHALALKRAARLALHMDEYEKISFRVSDEIMRLCEDGCSRLSMTPYYLYRQKNMAGNFENVGFAKPRKAGLYNILIMEEAQCILACGASGSTKIVYGDGRIERIENVKDVRSYLERIDEMIARKDRIKE